MLKIKMNNKIFKLILILIIIIIFLGGGYIISQKLFHNTQIEINKEEQLNLNDEIIQNLYKMVSIDAPYKWYFYENNYVTLDLISEEQKLIMAYHQVPQSMIKRSKKIESGDFIVDAYVLNIEELDKAIKKVFGENIEYKKSDFNPTLCDFFEYNDSSKEYIARVGGCGDSELRKIEKRFYKATEDNDNIVIYEKFALIDIEEIYDRSTSNFEPDTSIKPSGLYKDVNEEYIIVKFDELEDADNIDITKYYDQLSMVKYTFKKDKNGEYHFYSSEIID